MTRTATQVVSFKERDAQTVRQFDHLVDRVASLCSATQDDAKAAAENIVGQEPRPARMRAILGPLCDCVDEFRQIQGRLSCFFDASLADATNNSYRDVKASIDSRSDAVATAVKSVISTQTIAMMACARLGHSDSGDTVCGLAAGVEALLIEVQGRDFSISSNVSSDVSSMATSVRSALAHLKAIACFMATACEADNDWCATTTMEGLAKDLVFLSDASSDEGLSPFTEAGCVAELARLRADVQGRLARFVCAKFARDIDSGAGVAYLAAHFFKQGKASQFNTTLNMYLINLVKARRAIERGDTLYSFSKDLLAHGIYNFLVAGVERQVMLTVHTEDECQNDVELSLEAAMAIGHLSAPLVAFAQAKILIHSSATQTTPLKCFASISSAAEHYLQGLATSQRGSSAPSNTHAWSSVTPRRLRTRPSTRALRRA